MGDHINGIKVSENDMEALYAEFVRRFTYEQEIKQNGTPLPLEITTELDGINDAQQEDNFKRFKRESKRYALEKWTILERINSELYKEINRHKTDSSDVIAKIYEITDTTRFQAKVATEIFEELQYTLEHSNSLDEARQILQRATEQSKRLAIYGFAQAKAQERIAKNYAVEALNLPASIRYQV